MGVYVTTMIELCQQAIHTGATITIVYNGGSQPGHARLVIPISVTKDELVAREPSVAFPKHFKLPKVASVQLATGEMAINADATPAPAPTLHVPILESFAEYTEFFRAYLQGAHLAIDESELYFAISGFFKNGKPRKTSLLSISYWEPGFASMLNFETGEVEHVQSELTGRERPWCIRSDRLESTRSFSLLPNAAELFFQELQAFAALA